MLLYWDNKESLLKKPKYFWASIAVPVALVGALIATVALQKGAWMGHLIQLMFFTVGWHYVKQIFGCIIVSSVHRKIFYSKNERTLMLGSLYTIWLFNWLGPQTSTGSFEFYGIVYPSLGVPALIVDIGFYAVIIATALFAGLHFRKYIHDNVVPAPPAMVAFASLLIWYIPLFSHPGFGYLIPFFHSLQYLVFVTVYKKNEATFKAQSFKDKEQRKVWVQGFFGYLGVAGILGALFFSWLPNGLDTYSAMAPGVMGPTPWMALFILFINIHHYFIDNVIWKSDNEQVKKYLFQAQSQKTDSKKAVTAA